MIRKYAVTDASIHDSNMFEELLDEDNSSRDIWADSAYRSKDHVSEVRWNMYLKFKQCGPEL